MLPLHLLSKVYHVEQVPPNLYLYIVVAPAPANVGACTCIVSPNHAAAWKYVANGNDGYVFAGHQVPAIFEQVVGAVANGTMDKHEG